MTPTVYTKIPAGYDQVKRGKIKVDDILLFKGARQDYTDEIQLANGLIGRNIKDGACECYRKTKNKE